MKANIKAITVKIPIVFLFMISPCARSDFRLGLPIWWFTKMAFLAHTPGTAFPPKQTGCLSADFTCPGELPKPAEPGGTY